MTQLQQQGPAAMNSEEQGMQSQAGTDCTCTAGRSGAAGGSEEDARPAASAAAAADYAVFEVGRGEAAAGAAAEAAGAAEAEAAAGAAAGATAAGAEAAAAAAAATGAAAAVGSAATAGAAAAESDDRGGEVLLLLHGDEDSEPTHLQVANTWEHSTNQRTNDKIGQGVNVSGWREGGRLLMVVPSAPPPPKRTRALHHPKPCKPLSSIHGPAHGHDCRHEFMPALP